MCPAFILPDGLQFHSILDDLSGLLKVTYVKAAYHVQKIHVCSVQPDQSADKGRLRGHPK